MMVMVLIRPGNPRKNKMQGGREEKFLDQKLGLKVILHVSTARLECRMCNVLYRQGLKGLDSRGGDSCRGATALCLSSWEMLGQRRQKCSQDERATESCRGVSDGFHAVVGAILIRITQVVLTAGGKQVSKYCQLEGTLAKHTQTHSCLGVQTGPVKHDVGR